MHIDIYFWKRQSHVTMRMCTVCGLCSVVCVCVVTTNEYTPCCLSLRVATFYKCLAGFLILCTFKNWRSKFIKPTIMEGVSLSSLHSRLKMQRLAFSSVVSIFWLIRIIFTCPHTISTNHPLFTHYARPYVVFLYPIPSWQFELLILSLRVSLPVINISLCSMSSLSLSLLSLFDFPSCRQ